MLGRSVLIRCIAGVSFRAEENPRRSPKSCKRCSRLHSFSPSEWRLRPLLWPYRILAGQLFDDLLRRLTAFAGRVSPPAGALPVGAANKQHVAAATPGSASRNA